MHDDTQLRRVTDSKIDMESWILMNWKEEVGMRSGADMNEK
jgi:hypothetical protein